MGNQRILSKLAALTRLSALNLMLVLLLTGIAPARNFSSYTFALTWQPGMCQTSGGCRRDQPRTPLIGLHGLWASLPQDLRKRGVVNRQWFAKGCAIYGPSNGAPPLRPELRRKLEALMPHFRSDLLTHEYDKHVKCFALNATRFFETALAMRQAVVSSAFGSYLQQHIGRTVKHADVVNRFTATFHTPVGAALALQCERTSRGFILTQIWMIVHANALAVFPHPAAFMDPHLRQDTCPQHFTLPSWKFGSTESRASR